MVTQTKHQLNDRLSHILTAVDTDARLRGVQGIISLPLYASPPPSVCGSSSSFSSSLSEDPCRIHPRQLEEVDALYRAADSVLPACTILSLTFAAVNVPKR